MLIDNSSKIYNGQTEITKVYAGTNVVYEKLPYTPLNYIESTGTQYIDTGYYATSDNIKLEMKFNQTLQSGHAPLFGCYISSPYYQTTVTLYNGYYFASNYNSTGITYNSNTDYELVFIVNGNSSRTGTYSITSNGILRGTGNRVGSVCKTAKNYLFSQGVSGGKDWENGIAKVYYLKFYDNNVLVRDFIPVLDTNNVPCLYDKVSQTFYYNAGTGTFLYG